MTGNEGHVITQRPELLGDSVDQILMIAAREIGASDGSLKYNVADHRQL